MQNILISVIVPCYNQALYLSEALDLVLGQSFVNWECIIVNDGSPDNTEVIAKKYCATDKRFKYVYKDNGGLSSARNCGIKIAIGKYILPLDADDKIGPDYLKESLLILENDTDVKIVYCNAELFGTETGKWYLQDYSIEAILEVNMIFCCSLFRKSDYSEVLGGYDISLLDGHEDWDIWLSLLKNGGDVIKLDKVHFYYRKKNVSMLAKMTNETKIKIDNYIHIKHADLLFKVLGNPILLNQQLQFYKIFYCRIQNDIFFKIKKKITQNNALRYCKKTMSKFKLFLTCCKF